MEPGSGPASPLSDDARLARVAELIVGSPHNLVSRAERPRVATVHVPEAVALVPHLEARSGSRWLDLGTGGGLPGLVLAICLPEVSWVLLDSVAKKVAAVESFAAELALENVTAVAGRAEDLAHLPGWRGAFDGVVARAVAPLPVLLELSRGFLPDGGRLAAVKGPTWEDELGASEEAMRVLGWHHSGTLGIKEAVRPTWLVTMQAVGSIPRRFPRRPGVPKASPIGGESAWKSSKRPRRSERST